MLTRQRSVSFAIAVCLVVAACGSPGGIRIPVAASTPVPATSVPEAIRSGDVIEPLWDPTPEAMLDSGVYRFLPEDEWQRLRDLESWELVNEIEIDHPREVSVNTEGVLLVANQGEVVRIEPAGDIISFGSFAWSNGTAIGPDGHYWVTDSRGTSEVHRFDADGSRIASFASFGSGAGELACPTSVDVSADGTVFVVDADNDRLQVFTDEGDLVTMWGGTGSTPGRFRLNCASAAVAVWEDTVWVSDLWNDRAQSFDHSGVWLSSFAPIRPFSERMVSIDLDDLGTVWTVNGNGQIARSDQNGALLEVVNVSPRTTNGAGYNHMGIAVSSHGDRVWVTAHDETLEPGGGRVFEYQRRAGSAPVERPAPDVARPGRTDDV